MAKLMNCLATSGWLAPKNCIEGGKKAVTHIKHHVVLHSTVKVINYKLTLYFPTKLKSLLREDQLTFCPILSFNHTSTYPLSDLHCLPTERLCCLVVPTLPIEHRKIVEC